MMRGVERQTPAAAAPIRWRSNPSARRLWGMHAPTASSKPCNWSIRMPDPTAIDPLAGPEIALVRSGRDPRWRLSGQGLRPIGRAACIQEGHVTRRPAAGRRSEGRFSKIKGDGARRRPHDLGEVEHRPDGACDRAIQRQKNPDRVFTRYSDGHEGEGHELSVRLIVKPPQRGRQGAYP